MKAGDRARMASEEAHITALQTGIIRDMSEGVLTINMQGRVMMLNPAAEAILELSSEDLVGTPFAATFFETSENDAFAQLILDAIYDTSQSHRSVVPYTVGGRVRQLAVTTSFLRDGEKKAGVVAVISDITEVEELRDAVRAMREIERLNKQLSLRNELLSATFGRFLSDEIVRELLDTPGGLTLGGKKRDITIVMSDLRGFTAMSERMHPDALIRMLNHYLGEMADTILRYGGTVIEFIGDGILSIFGAPTHTKTHAADAVAAAVAMEAAMEGINAWNRAEGYPELQMGIGVNTGEVIVGNIGSEKRTKYGVVGSNVNLCGRIESYTVGGQILVSPTTVAQIEEPLQVAAEQEVFPKGVNAPLRLSHVIGIGGRYQLRCPTFEEELVPLSCPAEALFFAIREKHVEQTPATGKISALGRTGALLSTEEALAPYENLQIEVGGKLYAKVVARQEDGYRLRFTAFPVSFETWYDEVMARQKT